MSNTRVQGREILVYSKVLHYTFYDFSNGFWPDVVLTNCIVTHHFEKVLFLQSELCRVLGYRILCAFISLHTVLVAAVESVFVLVGRLGPCCLS